MLIPETSRASWFRKRSPCRRCENDLRDVSQIVLTLIVFRFDFTQRREEWLGFKTVNAGVDLTNLAFLFSRVALFDDLSERVVFVANDASVAGRVFETNAENRTGGASVVGDAR